MSVKVSIVVPIYNVEKYIRECIDSILSQTYKDYEIILVDDGSTDGSGAIADEYSKIDSRVMVIHKSNGGLSDARNHGIDVAKGDYICFVDSDDWVENDYLEELVDLVGKTNADIAICGFLRNNGSEKIVQPDDIRVYEEKGIDAIDNYFGEHYTEYVVAWNKLYRRDIFNELRYPVGMIHEDEAIFADLFCAAELVVRTEKVLYNYRINNNSSIMSSEYSIKRLDVLKAIEMRMARYQKEGLRKHYEKDSYKYLYKILLNIIAVKDSKCVDNNIIGELKKKYWKKYRESLGFDWTIARKAGMLFFGIFPRAFLLRYKK